MTRFKTASGQFGLIGGICRATSDCILVREPSPTSPAARWKGRLYVLVEPATEGGRVYSVARQTAEEISRAYYDCSSTSITTCLSRAIQEANQSLFQRNMEASGHEKITLGVTCAAVRGKELLLAQVLPGQAYLAHQGRIRAFPLNPSWDPEAPTRPTMVRLLALGWMEEISPEFFHSPLDMGDLFCLCSSNIGRSLGEKEAEQILLYQEPGDVIEQLYRRIHQQGFSEAHAIVVEMQPVLGRQTAPFFSLAGLGERARAAGEAVKTWGNSLVGEARRLFQRRQKPAARTEATTRFRKPARQPRPKPTPPAEIASLARPKPAQPWRKRLPEIWHRITHPKIGFPRLQRPRLRIQAPKERRRLIAPILGFAALTVLAVLVYFIYQANAQSQETAVIQQIDQAKDQIDLAARTSDVAEANQILDEAEDLLKQAQTKGRLLPQIELELAHLQQERDRINDVTRLLEFNLVFSATEVTASFPGACSENCVFGDLVLLGNSIYLLEEDKGTVYLYAPATNEISPVLWEGMEIQGRTAAPIRAIARMDRPKDCALGEETEPWLAAVDADRWLYLHYQGQWETYTLFSESPWEERPIDLEGYLGNAYVLKGELGQLLKYYCNAYELAPDRWIEDPRQISAEDAVDMAIDGHIYLLMKDGTVLDLLQGEIENTLSYEVYPPTIVPSHIFTDMEINHLYVSDRYTGRIIQLRKQGDGEAVFLRQLWGPNDGDLQDLRAVAVRESQGVVYIVTGLGLYRGVVPSPTPEPTLTPSPSPTP